MARSSGSGKSGSTHDFLKDQAIRGRLQPGRHLAPGDLADQFRVSITPIREALARLTEQGFLTWTASRGYFTKPFTVVEQRDLSQMLTLSVVFGLGLGRGAGAAGWLEAFVGLPDHPSVRDPSRAEAVAAALTSQIEALIQGAAEATGNQVLADMVRNCLERTHLVRRYELGEPQARVAVAQGYSMIAQALQAGDVAAAAAEADAQLQQLAQRLPGAVALANSEALQAPFP